MKEHRQTMRLEGGLLPRALPREGGDPALHVRAAACTLKISWARPACCGMPSVSISSRLLAAWLNAIGKNLRRQGLDRAVEFAAATQALASPISSAWRPE